MVGNRGGSTVKQMIRSVLAAVTIGIWCMVAVAASFDKAAKYIQRGNLEAARKQYRGIIENGTLKEKEKAYLALSQSYFQEKDFRSVLRVLAPISTSMPKNINGAKMHLMAYRAARSLGETEPASMHYLAFLRLGIPIPMAEIRECLLLIRSAGLLKKPGGIPMEADSDEARRMNLAIAEKLTTLDIIQGASRIWRALAFSKLDNVSRNALLRLGQSLDIEGDHDEASRYLAYYVLLFAEDTASADALYRLGRWHVLQNRKTSSMPYEMFIEFYPTTIYGAAASIDLMPNRPSKPQVVALLQTLRECPGLPDAVLEKGLNILMDGNSLLDSGDRIWVAGRYLSKFPLGSRSAAARKIQERKPASIR